MKKIVWQWDGSEVVVEVGDTTTVRAVLTDDARQTVARALARVMETFGPRIEPRGAVEEMERIIEEIGAEVGTQGGALSQRRDGRWW